MKNEYLEYIKWDEELYSVIREDLKKFETLTPYQIESIVFYLKSLQSDSSKSENIKPTDFLLTLDNIRNNSEQKNLQEKCGRFLIKGIILCVASGVMLTGSIFSFLSGGVLLGILLLIASVVLIIFSESRFFHKALATAKEQDRRFFLSSIRTAKNCNQLNDAGLFAYTKSWKKDSRSNIENEKIHDEICTITKNLRTALYNDKDLDKTDLNI